MPEFTHFFEPSTPPPPQPITTPHVEQKRPQQQQQQQPAATSTPINALTQQPSLMTPMQLKQSTDYVNHALATFGFPSQLKFYKAGREEVSKIVSCFMTILQSHQRDLERLSLNEDRLQRLESDHESLIKQLSKLKQSLEVAERQSDAANVSLQVTTQSLSQSTAELTDLRDEYKNAKQNLTYCRTSHAHEIRKREKDTLKMRTSMQKMLTDSYKSAAKVSFELLNPVVSGISSQWKTSCGDAQDDLVDEMVAQAELNEKRQIEENLKLRSALYECYRMLCSFTLSETLMNESKRKQPIFDLPWDQVEDQIIDLVQDALTQLQDSVSQFHQQTVDTGSEHSQLIKENKELQSQIKEYSKVMSEQAKLIELALVSKTGNVSLNDNNHDSDKNNNEITRCKYDDEMRKMEQQRKQLDDERKRFTEAAIKLGKERALFQAEREKFQDSKRSQVTQRVLDGFPSTPSWLKQSYSQNEQDENFTPVPNRQSLQQLSTPAALAAVNGKMFDPQVSQIFSCTPSSIKHVSPGGSGKKSVTFEDKV